VYAPRLKLVLKAAGAAGGRFSPFSIDEKPNHGSTEYARDVAFRKIKNRVEGTRMAAERLGVGNLVSA
jgi:hypothetical protein